MLLQKSTKRTPALMVAVLLLSAIVFFVFMRGSSYAGDPAGYALFENGTVLDEGVLIYYTIPGLKQLWRDAVSGNAVFDDDARREVLDQLPFSEAAGQQFLEKYNDGKTWYLVDTVQTLYKNAENTPDQPSTAYIVSSRGVSALEFIFITRNDEQFFVHIDTDDVNAEIKTALTGYSETAGPPPQQIMRASALLAPGGTPAGELELSDTEVAGSEFLIDQDVAIASVLIVGQGEEGTHTWTKVTQYSELQNGQIWTYKEVEEVTPGANDGLFKITLYAWAKPFAVTPDLILLDSDLVISDDIGLDYLLCDAAGVLIPLTDSALRSDGSTWEESETGIVWTIPQEHLALMDSTGPMTAEYYVKLDPALLEGNEGKYYTSPGDAGIGWGTAQFTPTEKNGYYYEKETPFVILNDVEWALNNANDDKINANGGYGLSRIIDSGRDIEIYIGAKDLIATPNPPAPYTAADGFNFYCSSTATTVNGVNNWPIEIWCSSPGTGDVPRTWVLRIPDPDNSGQFLTYKIANKMGNSPDADSISRRVEYDEYHKKDMPYWDSEEDIVPDGRTEPLGVVGWTTLVHPLSLYKYGFDGGDASFGEWLDGVEFSLFNAEGDDLIGTYTTDNGRISFPYLPPGDYYLLENPATVPEAYIPNEARIYFTVADRSDTRLSNHFEYSPGIVEVDGEDVSFDRFSGLVLFVGNKRIPGDITLRVKKSLPEDKTPDIYENAHGTAKFLFLVEAFDKNANLAEDEPVWSRVGFVEMKNDSREDKIVVFGGNPATDTVIDLDYGYIYRVTEVDVMRYASSSSELAFRTKADVDYSESGAAENCVIINLSVPGRINGRQLVTDDTTEVLVTFTNERKTEDYLSDSSVKVNRFTIDRGESAS